MLSPLRFLLVRIGFLSLVGLALFNLATITPAAAATAADGKQLLLIHDDAKVTEPLVAFLKAKGGFETLVVDQAHLPDGDWSGYRAVLGYVHGRLQEAAEGAVSVGKFVSEIPRLLTQAEAAADAFSAFAAEGVRLDQHTIERLAEAQSRQSRAGRIALWIGALSLLAIAVALVF